MKNKDMALSLAVCGASVAERQEVAVKYLAFYSNWFKSIPSNFNFKVYQDVKHTVIIDTLKNKQHFCA